MFLESGDLLHLPLIDRWCLRQCPSNSPHPSHRRYCGLVVAVRLDVVPVCPLETVALMHAWRMSKDERRGLMVVMKMMRCCQLFERNGALLEKTGNWNRMS